MFKLTAIVNFLMTNDKMISIVCKVFERLKIGDSLIYIGVKDKREDYKIKKIYGFKEKELLETVEGCTYRIVVEPIDCGELIKLIKSGDQLFSEHFFDDTYQHLELPNLITIGEHQEQFYKIILKYKNYEDRKDEEIKKLIQILDLLESYGYQYQYDSKMQFIENKISYLEEQIQYTEADFSTIGLYLTNSFSIWGHVGSRNSNFINYLDILLPVKCSFGEDDVNSSIIRLFQELNNILTPVHSFADSNENIKRFSFIVKNGLPTSIQYINYFSDDLRKKISSLYHVELPDYLICRNFPFDDCALDDLKIQQQLYQKYQIDQMTKDLQKIYFYTEKELIFYCNIYNT